MARIEAAARPAAPTLASGPPPGRDSLPEPLAGAAPEIPPEEIPAATEPSIPVAKTPFLTIPGTPLSVPLLERDELLLAILFTGTFFPRMSYQEFEQALLIAMGADTMKDPAEEPAGTRRREPRPRPLRELWEKHGDRRIHECQLELCLAGDGRRVLDFITPVRPWLAEQFEASLPRYTFRLWDRLLSSGWLFEENLSPQAQRNLLRVARKAAHFAPETYGVNLLFAVLHGLNEHVQALSRRGQSELVRHVGERLEAGLRTPQDLRRLAGTVFRNRAFWAGKTEEKVRHIYSRLAQLCSALLEERRLARAVTDFFQGLFDGHEFFPLLAIGEKLQDSANFDFPAWLRRMLDAASAAHWLAAGDDWLNEDLARHFLATRQSIYTWLDRRLALSDERALDLLEAVRKWVPPEKKKSAEFTFSECYALTFPLRFCATTDRAEEFWHEGITDQVPSNPQLDRWLAAEEAEAPAVRQEIQAWSQWLCHPGLGAGAGLHGLDRLIGQIQADQPGRVQFLEALSRQFRELGALPPHLDDLATWENLLKEMSQAADIQDLRAHQIAEALRLWAMSAEPAAGEPEPAAQALLAELTAAVAAGLRSQRPIAAKVDRIWFDAMEDLLSALGEAEPSKESRPWRARWKGLRSILYRLRKLFQQGARGENAAG
jgi:hypothetical protein